MNIKFHYLYRDAGNYKQYHFKIFSNQKDLSLKEIDNKIRSALIDQCWFYADRWQLKDLHVYKWDESIDHRWHEFDLVEITDEMETKGDIGDFINLIQNLAK